MVSLRLLEKYEACQKDPSYLAYLQSNSPLTQPPISASQPAPPLPSLTWRLAPSTPPTGAPPTSTTAVGVGSQREVKGEGCGRLARSLLSGFPNEVDFAFNVFTIMSFKSPASFPLAEVRLRAKPRPPLTNAYTCMCSCRDCWTSCWHM